LLSIRSRVGLVGRDAERFERYLGLGECKTRRREVLRHLRVEPFEFGESLQAEDVSGDR
jgi:hypothetical protein